MSGQLVFKGLSQTSICKQCLLDSNTYRQIYKSRPFNWHNYSKSQNSRFDYLINACVVDPRNKIPSISSYHQRKNEYSTKTALQQRQTSYSPKKPAASEVLSCHLRQRCYPPWTSYFVKYSSVKNDQFGRSHFNWDVDGRNYHVLRTGCFPYIKYHCTQRPYQDIRLDDRLIRILKMLNLGIPTLAYGLVSIYLISCEEKIPTSRGPVSIYFHIEEDPTSQWGQRHT